MWGADLSSLPLQPPSLPADRCPCCADIKNIKEDILSAVPVPSHELETTPMLHTYKDATTAPLNAPQVSYRE